MRIYAVVASDTLRRAFDKGEIKERYWNPGNIFDEVHVIVLADEDIEPERVRKVAGRARLHIHPVGGLSLASVRGLRARVCDKLEAIKPDVIRGHGPFLQGYFAVYAARRLGIPCFVSIHDDISIYRRYWTYGSGFWRFAAYQVGLKLLGWEQFVYRYADRLVPKYEAAGRLLMQSRYRDKTEVIYNEVFLEQFLDLSPELGPEQTLKIINVGRQFEGKDQRPLIEAIKELDAELTLVGTGPLRGKLVRAAERYGVSERVHFVDAIPHHELPDEYARHHLFAMNILQPGVSMTVMEAMALGFPVVINRPRWEHKPEVCGDSAFVVGGSAESFRDAFAHFLDHPDQIRVFGKRSREAIGSYSGEEMEQRERELVLSLMATAKSLSSTDSPATQGPLSGQ